MDLIERMTKCADGMYFHPIDDLNWRADIIREGIAEIERLRAALKDIRDDVPKIDIHYQGKVATDIAAAALALNQQIAEK